MEAREGGSRDKLEKNVYAAWRRKAALSLQNFINISEVPEIWKLWRNATLMLDNGNLIDYANFPKIQFWTF